MSIYFLACDDARLVKIGYAVNVDKRVKQLRTGNPFPMRLLGWLPGSRSDECLIHDALMQHRRRWEWFDAEPAAAFLSECHNRDLGAVAAEWRATYERETSASVARIRKDVARACALFAMAIDHEIRTRGMAELSAGTGISPKVLQRFADGSKRVAPEHLLSLASYLGPPFMSEVLAPIGMMSRGAKLVALGGRRVG
jgi:hypothetical protein